MKPHLTAIAMCVLAGATARSGEPPDFRREIAPLFEKHCLDCHRGSEAESGVRLDLRAEMLGETTGRALAVPGEASRSRLIELVSGRDPTKRMPPEGEPLNVSEVALLRRWIDAGLPWDDQLYPPLKTVSDHWAFQSVVRPLIPPAPIDLEIDNPVDAFVAARQHAAGVAFAAEADRRTLIRRLSFDLLGLPPTHAEVESFAADDRPDAYERLVDRLLASPHYGERWGRHWLDVARWAESEGFESNHPRAFAWRYRDYVIDSFNRDRPFDHFLTQQIAGDELSQYRDENLIATGFLAAARISSNEEDKWLQRNDVNVDITNAVGSAILGVTLHCAQCHNHKFDPITARDYYRLQAFFIRGQPSSLRLRDPEHVSDDDARQAAEYQSLVEQQQAIFELGRQRYIALERAKLSDDERAVLDVPLDQRTPAQELLARKAALNFQRTAGEYEKHIPETERAAYNDLKKRLAELEKQLPRVPQTFAYYSPVQSPHRLATLPELGFYPLPFDPEFFRFVRPYVMVRGDVHNIGLPVQAGWPVVLAPPEPPPNSARELRRTDLANWLTDRRHPLVARVWANRLWHYHFGRGLVATTDDFGLRGSPPTHPELLDWLAAELLDGGWSTRHVQRLIVTSRTYRQTARANHDRDPDNRWLTRFESRRLEAETLRDAMLAVANELDRMLGGPSVPIEARDQSRRRSMYLFQKRGQVAQMQALFDGPNECSASCGNRLISTSPLQSLYLLNSPFSWERSQRMAATIAVSTGDDADDPITAAFRLILQRPPTDAERQSAQKLLAANHDLGIALLCQTLLNLNEFAYVE